MEPEDLLRCVVVACEQLKLRYLVTGSTAIRHWLRSSRHRTCAASS
jgi:hypothetical protein